MYITKFLFTIKKTFFLRQFLFLFILFSSFKTEGQVNENYSFVNNYLYRMAQKGIINIQDYTLPLDRFEIIKALESIKKSESFLSVTEKKELIFLNQEYQSSININDTSIKPLLLRKDNVKRFRFFQFINKDAQLFIDPIIGGSYSTYNNKNNIINYSGARLYGNLGKKIGYNLLFRDITERGDSVDFFKSFSPETGIFNTSRNPKQLNYSQLNFNIGYRWKNGMLSIGKDHLNWGYGKGGKIVLSSKAPSFPYIKLDYQPFKWLKFNYFNAWLNSNIIDSSRSYSTGTGVGNGFREVMRQKYLAHHSISFIPIKGLEISIGESIIYSDKLEIGYLIPINFFKLYDQYASSFRINGGSNSQLFAQISSRNQLKNTHFYFNIFIDELRLSKIFDKTDSRNQLGYTVGINKTDFFLHYLTVGVEYTRINPFVYKNIIPAQTYENASYSMGDWIGNNADRLYLFGEFTPFSRFKINVSYQSIRKGALGTLNQQYNQQPQPQFLFGPILKQVNVLFECSYEYLNRLNFFSRFGYLNRKFENPNFANQSQRELSVGFSYGF